MPKEVDKYYKKVKENNPDYDDEKAWATAWSIYCKYKNPGSPSCKKPTSEYLKKKSSRYPFLAMEFESPEALREYLKNHPNADKSKHTVKKKKDGDEELAEFVEKRKKDDETEEAEKAKKQKVKLNKMESVAKDMAMSLASPQTLNKYLGKEDTYEYEVKFDDDPKTSWKDKIKSLGSKVTSFIKSSPEQVKKFIQDESFRKETLNKVMESAKKAPGKMWSNIKHTLKEEVHEFKEAGHGVKALLSGKKMTHEQKHALKTVSFHVALGLSAALLTPTAVAAGPLGVGGAFAKGFAKHIALKCVSSALGHLHVLEEFGHVGHGIKHFMEHLAAHNDIRVALLPHFAAKQSIDDVDTDQVLEDFIRAVLVKELSKFKDKDMAQALDFASKEKPEKQEKTSRTRTASLTNIIRYYEQTV